MGSKNLRAVAALGKEKIDFFDPEFLRKTAQDYAKTFKDIELGKTLFVYGTTAFCGILSAIGMRGARIMMLFLAESSLLAVGGVILGLILAIGSIPSIMKVVKV